MSLLVLFGWSFAAATILPLASEVPLAVVVSNSGTWVVPVIVATTGNTLGACTTYWLAWAAVAVAPASRDRTRRASALLATYGAPTLLFSWVPVIGDLLVVLAGAGRMSIWRFIGWTAVGKTLRYVAVAVAVEKL